MSTSKRISDIKEDDVTSVLNKVIVSVQDKYALMLSLVLIYGLELMLVSKDSKADETSDIYGLRIYGGEWYRVKDVSIAFSCYTYDKQILINSLKEVLDARIIPVILKARNFNEDSISVYIENLNWLLEELKNE